MATITRKYDYTAQRVGFVMKATGDLVNFDNMWMGVTKDEVIRGIVTINKTRESMGLDALNWVWGR